MKSLSSEERCNVSQTISINTDVLDGAEKLAMRWSRNNVRMASRRKR